MWLLTVLWGSWGISFEGLAWLGAEKCLVPNIKYNNKAGKEMQIL